MIKRITKLGLLFITFIFILDYQFDSDNLNIIESKETENDKIEISKLIDVQHFQHGALEHILEGEINHKGYAVGFHYEGLPTQKGKVIASTRTTADEHGV